MKALVTGGAGFIGSHLVDSLVNQNFEVIVLDNLSTGRMKNINHHLENENFKFVEIDISTDHTNWSDYFTDIDYIFHLAALADIVPSVTNPESYFKSNVIGTFNVLEASKKSDKLKKIVYAASASCYGIPKQFPTPEQSQIQVEYPYALTKHMGEEMLLHWGKVYKTPVVSTRFFNAYGPRARTSGTYGAVFGVFLAQKLANKPFTVVGDGSQTRDFTYISDIISGVCSAAFSDIKNESINLGSGGTYSINELVSILQGEIVYIPKRPGEPDCTFADISKAKSLLNWSPKVSFQEGVKKMLEHIDYWKDAPVWEPTSIERETKVWFEALGENNT